LFFKNETTEIMLGGDNMEQASTITPHGNGMIFLPYFTDIYITYGRKRIRIENCEEFF